MASRTTRMMTYSKTSRARAHEPRRTPHGHHHGRDRAAFGSRKACTAYRHGFPPSGALVAMTACGIINKEELRTGHRLGSLIFIGIVLGLGDVFAEAGITEWIVAEFTPLVMAMRAIPTHSSSASRSSRSRRASSSSRRPPSSTSSWLSSFHRNHPRHQSLGHRDGKLHGHQRLVRAVPKPRVNLAAFYSVDGKMAKHSSSPNTASSTRPSQSSACSSPCLSGEQWDCSRWISSCVFV